MGNSRGRGGAGGSAVLPPAGPARGPARAPSGQVSWRLGVPRCKGEGVPGRRGGGARRGGPRGWARPPRAARPPAEDPRGREAVCPGSGWPRSSPGQGGEAAAVAPVPELPPGKQSVESLVVSCAAWWPPTRPSPPPLGVWIPPPRPGPSCSTRRPVVSPTPPAPCTLLSHILPFTFSVCLFCPSRLRPLLSLLSHPFLA